MTTATDNQTKTQQPTQQASDTQSTQAAKTPSSNAAPRQGGGQQRSGGGQQKGDRRDQRSKGGKGGGRRGERAKPEFDHTVVDIRRVTRVVAGGRRFSFRVTVVAGDRRGRVGVGLGKAIDTPTAIDKAFRDAKANMVTITRTSSNSIPCEVQAKFCGSQVLVLPSPGRGIIAGSSIRPVLELAGVNDVTTKLISRSKNQLNNAKAAIRALAHMPTPNAADAADTQNGQSK